MNRKQKTVAGTIGALALMVFLALSLTIAPLASAGCGGVETSSAKKKVVPGRPPLAIGDSVMLLAIPNLARIGFKVNARGCRQFSEGISVIRHYKHQGRLPHLVVIGLGADWVITRQDIRRTLHILGPKRVLGLIVPREEGGGTSHDADVARSIWHFHRKHIMLLDWVRFSRGRGGWFQPDGLHLTYAGASAYTKLISKSLTYAKAGEFPNRSHFP